MKLVTKKMIKNVSKKLISDVIQESTDTIYQIEDDSITLADFILRSVLKQQIRELLNETRDLMSETTEKKMLKFLSFGTYMSMGSDIEIPSEFSPTK